MSEPVLTDYACKKMRANENFLLSHFEQMETIELINGAIECSHQDTENSNSWVKSSNHFFLNPILLPSSYAIHTHLLTGNLPACFRELRFLFESLAFCYFAENDYPNENSFLQQMEKYAKSPKSQKHIKSISKKIRDLGKITGIESEVSRVYGKLSEDWVHTRGFAEKVVNLSSDNKQLPSWSWILPITLGENDRSTINELNEYIAIFRDLLAKTIAITESKAQKDP